jgi:hypothetical protein
MTNRRGSWDLLRIVFMTTIPTVLLLFGGFMLVFRDTNFVELGIKLIYAGVVFLAIEIFQTTIIIFKKRVTCEGCPCNTEERFLDKYDK